MESRSGDRLHGFAIGNVVYTADGYRLGTVMLAHADEFVVESDLVVRRYYVLDCDEIDRSEPGRLVTSLTLEEARARERG